MDLMIMLKVGESLEIEDREARNGLWAEGIE